MYVTRGLGTMTLVHYLTQCKHMYHSQFLSFTKCGGAKAYVNARGSVVRRGATLKELTADLNKATAEVGRYHMGYAWKKGGKHGAHIITVEKIPDGSIRIYDPQSGLTHDINDFVKTISTKRYVLLYRVDNLHVNTSIIDEVVDVIS